MSRIATRPSQILDSIMDEFFSYPIVNRAQNLMTHMDIDMYEKGNNVIIIAEVSGANKDNVDITYDNSILTIEVSKEEVKEEQDKDKKYYYKEISSNKVSRSIKVPFNVDINSAEAEIKDGVITITLPKSENTKTNKIIIK